jgi:cysteine-rich repeat protein
VITGYSLDVDITGNLCGNNVVEAGETCDDGDATSFDGCSSTCQLEIEAVIMGAGGSYSAAINPIGNIDWYQVIVPAGAALRIETFAPADGQCTSGNDTVIRLYAADRTTQIDTDDESGVGSCSLLDPGVDTPVRNLAAGTYWITVEDWQNNGTIAAYVLDVEIRVPQCGDDLISGNEQCDDGNMASGDGCSATCQFEGLVESEPNGTTGTASSLIAAGSSSGRANAVLGSATDVDMFSVVVPAGGGHIIGEVSNGRDGCPGALTLRLRDSAGTQLSSDTGDGPAGCGRITPGGDAAARNLAAGTYYLEVSGAAAVAWYVIDARVVPNGCGDLYLVTGETCDDGNTVSGDGCSSTCALEDTEVEPNNTFGQAMTVVGPSRMIGGSISPAGESDWYAVDVAAGGSIHVAVHNGGPDQCGSIDPDVEVFQPNGTTSIAQDDLDGQGYCPVLYRYELWNLAAGRYLILVNGFDPADTFSYVLSVQVY